MPEGTTDLILTRGKWNNDTQEKYYLETEKLSAANLKTNNMIYLPDEKQEYWNAQKIPANECGFTTINPEEKFLVADCNIKVKLYDSWAKEDVNVNMYAFNTYDVKDEIAWPGTKLEVVGNTVDYNIKATNMTKIIVNITNAKGDKIKQTEDITLPLEQLKTKPMQLNLCEYGYTFTDVSEDAAKQIKIEFPDWYLNDYRTGYIYLYSDEAASDEAFLRRFELTCAGMTANDKKYLVDITLPSNVKSIVIESYKKAGEKDDYQWKTQKIVLSDYSAEGNNTASISYNKEYVYDRLKVSAIKK